MAMAPTNTATAPGAQLNQFHGFLNLAAELQIMIWKFASIDPSLLHVTIGQTVPRMNIDRDDFELTISTTKRPSGLLLACRLSREIYLESHTGIIEYGTRKIRFDPHADTIFLYRAHTNQTLPTVRPFERLPPTLAEPTPLRTKLDYQALFKNVANLILPIEYLDIFLSHWSENPNNYRAHLLHQFQSLKKVFIVQGDNTNHWWIFDIYNYTYAAEKGEDLVMLEEPEKVWMVNHKYRGALIVDRLEDTQTEVCDGIIPICCEEYKANTEGAGDWEIPEFKAVLLRAVEDDPAKPKSVVDGTRGPK